MGLSLAQVGRLLEIYEKEGLAAQQRAALKILNRQVDVLEQRRRDAE